MSAISSRLKITPITQKAKKLASIAIKKPSSFPDLMHLINCSIIRMTSIAIQGLNNIVITMPDIKYIIDFVKFT